LRLRLHFGQTAVVLSLLAAFAIPLAGQSESEDQLKGATLLAFVQNAHWADPSAANTPLTIGVVGRKGFLRWLRTGLEGRVIDGRPLQTLEIKGPIDPHCCQVLYFATDRLEGFAPALRSLSSAHVLTMGEADRFLDQGGAVNLYLVNGHIAFEVNLGALERGGIEISSKLLRFGQIRGPARGPHR
jgi:hypothetical protein